jgi:hypothetical protein
MRKLLIRIPTINAFAQLFGTVILPGSGLMSEFAFGCKGSENFDGV